MHICSSTSSWPRLRALWVWCLIIHAVGGGGTEILFSAYLGIYCSTECNITIQKQDPNHTNPTIPLSLCSSVSPPLSLSSITSPAAAKEPPVSPLAYSRSGYWSLIRWIHYTLITNCFITQCNNACQGNTTVLSSSLSYQCSVLEYVPKYTYLIFLLGWKQWSDNLPMIAFKCRKWEYFGAILSSCIRDLTV